MGHSLYQPGIHGERILHQFFPIACCRTALYFQRWIDTINFFQCFSHQFYRFPVRKHIFMIQNFIIFAYHHNFHSGRAGINTDMHSAAVAFQFAFRNNSLRMTFFERSIFCFIGKQRRQTAFVLLHFFCTLHILSQCIEIQLLFTARIQSCAICHIILGVFRKYTGIVVQFQHINKAFLQPF